MSIIGAAAISGAASLLGMGASSLASSKLNRRTINYNRDMYWLQREHALDDWHRLTDYDSPASQMQRLQEANLNPHLVYGSGADAQVGKMPNQASVQGLNQKMPNTDLGSVVTNALTAKQMEANIARTNAETDRINSETVSTKFQNELNEAIGIEKMMERYNWATDEIAIKSQRANLEFESWKVGALDDGAVTKNSPVAKAIKAGYRITEQQLKQAKIQEDISSAVKTVKQFEANLAKQGIHPNSPWGVKLIVDLLEDTGLLNKVKNLINLF